MSTPYPEPSNYAKYIAGDEAMAAVVIERLAVKCTTLEMEVEDLRKLVATADKMYAEHDAKVQAKSKAEYQAEFGHDGPRIASPLNSAGREYVYWRHDIGRKHNLPDAAIALGQRKVQ